MNLNYLVCRHGILAFTIVRWCFIEAIFLPYNTAISFHLCYPPLHVSFGLELLLSVVSIYVHTYIHTHPLTYSIIRIIGLNHFDEY